MPAKRSGPWPPRWLVKPTQAELARTDGGDVIRFIETQCRQTKDTVAGKVGAPIVLQGWQKQLVNSLYARNARTNRRRFRQALIGQPRKNGKSTLGAGFALYGLLCDVEGAEVYSCAVDKDQARIVFSMAKRICELNPDLTEVVKPYRDALEVPSTGSVYRVLSSESISKEGLNPSTVVFDELHGQANSELWDVMNLGSGARAEPLIIGITTAGSRTDSRGQDTICYRLYQHLQRVVRGEIKDPSFFGAWWEPMAGEQADHRDPKVWAEANPGLGAGGTLDVEDLKSTVLRTSPSEFRTKRCNQWVVSAESALPHGAWDRLATSEPRDRDKDVVLFFDGSWAGDSTALVGATVEDEPFLFVVDVWENVDDVDWRVPIPDVEARIEQACRELPVVEVACDPYRWQRSLQALEQDGLPMVEWPMNLARVVPAWTSFSEAVMDGRLSHDGDPRLARHIENMVLKRDQRGVRPVKESKSSRRHIDLGICAMGAHDRAVARHRMVPETKPLVTAIVL